MNYNNYFEPVVLSKELANNTPLSILFEKKPVVLIRIDNAVSAYEDFCPHRGAPLSKGFIDNKQIHCAYHGWAFDGKNGENTALPVKNAPINCKLKPVPIVEKYGIIWLSSSETAQLPTLFNDTASIETHGIIKAKLVNILENFLEGSHTHYVHNGLIRSQNKARQLINVKLVPNEQGFKVYYDPELAKGLVTKILPKKYQNLKPVATYIYPNIAILEYFSQEDILISRFEGIIGDGENETKYFARILLNFGFFTPFVAFFARFAFLKIIEQDKKILEIQHNNLKQFQEYKFISDETDTVGKHIFTWLNDRNNVLKETIHFSVFV
jgi:phenylpropionate dioxygenase-like ring-hydroxylating dioxygenase large terminal subunit